MAHLEIPIDVNQPDHVFSIDLDKKIYLLRFMYNYRGERWTMTISDEAGTVLVAGIALVLNASLLSRFTNESLPPGTFFVLDTSGENAEPTEKSFEQTHTLIYAEVGTE